MLGMQNEIKNKLKKRNGLFGERVMSTGRAGKQEKATGKGIQKACVSIIYIR